jgi:hypothetical protein
MMNQSDATNRLDLGTIIAALHDSEINGEVSWFYDGVWRVKLGDEENGFVAEALGRYGGLNGDFVLVEG